MSQPPPDAVFDPLRPQLLRVAYRMLGSVADAEDVVQDAFLRWFRTDRSDIKEPAAFLQRVVTRLCLDQLKSARRKRETYVGTWLPEPVVEDEATEVDDVTLPLLMALERLSPLERAAFLLHDVFGESFDDVSETLGRAPAACRQRASRARSHVQATRPRFRVEKEHGRRIAEEFFAASRSGDTERLGALLADDVTIYADGGGKVLASTRPVVGSERVLKFLGGLMRWYEQEMSRLVRYAFVNGLPGFVTIEGGGTLQTTALEIENGRISSIYVVRNPDKLQHVPRLPTQ